jgi:predicted anti-sigma-YlaC factor YlaD
MNCKKSQQWISQDLDGELSARRKVRLDAHLESCAACRELREQWARVGARLRETRPAAAVTPEAAWADVRRAIRNAGATPAPEAPWIFVPALRWAAATALAVVIGLFVMRTIRGPTPAGVAAAPPAQGTTVELVETDLPGAAPMVYEDAGSGLTVIWVVEKNNQEGGHAGS